MLKVGLSLVKMVTWVDALFLFACAISAVGFVIRENWYALVWVGIAVSQQVNVMAQRRHAGMLKAFLDFEQNVNRQKLDHMAEQIASHARNLH